MSKGDFITEPQFYKLAIKANNQVAEKFQNWVTSEGRRQQIVTVTNNSQKGGSDCASKNLSLTLPRDVEAVILKNRNGATGDTLHYAYYSMFNKFLDMDDTENYSQQSKPESRTQVDDDGRVCSSNKEYREFLEGQTN